MHAGLKARAHQLMVEKYSPDQPRAPAGDPDGGQWISAGGSGSGVFYRGEGPGTGSGNYYSTDKDFARQFTQSGLDSEVKVVEIKLSDIHKMNPLPRATNEGEMDAAMSATKKAGKKAFYVDEGGREPNSVFVMDRSAVSPSRKR